MSKRTQVVLSERLELIRLRQLQALDQLVPWKEEDHPELKQGAAKYVRKLRQQSERRFKKVTTS